MKILALLFLFACSGGSKKPACGVATTAATPAGVRELHFPAGDGVTVTADLSMPHPATAPMIVLFHQAGYSRGESRTLAKGKLLIWGSSYSSSLVLVLGAELKADAVLSFSPGEYFDDQGKPKTWVADSAKALAVPVFITSAKDEAKEWAPIAAAIDPAKLATFVPETAGHHGSSTLWPTQPDRDAYWTAVTAFLKPFV